MRRGILRKLTLTQWHVPDNRYQFSIKLNGGLSRPHSADEDAVLWLTSYGWWHAYEKKKKKKKKKKNFVYVNGRSHGGGGRGNVLRHVKGRRNCPCGGNVRIPCACTYSTGSTVIMLSATCSRQLHLLYYPTSSTVSEVSFSVPCVCSFVCNFIS